MGLKHPDGTIEFIEPQQYLLKNCAVKTDTPTYTFEMSNMLDFWTEKYLQDEYTGQTRTLYDIAVAVLEQVEMFKQFDGEIIHKFSEVLQSITTKAPIPALSIKEILQLIANAAGCMLSIDPTTGYPKIDTLEMPMSDRVIGKNQQLGDPLIESTEELKSIKISVNSYELGTEVEQIFKGEYTLSAESTITIEYEPSTDVSAVVSNATVNAAKYYSNSAVLTITPIVPDQIVTVTLNGKQLIRHVTMLETYNNTTITKGLDVELINPFITDVTLAKSLSEKVKDYYERRHTGTIKYIGYPEIVAGDQLRVISKYNDSIVQVLENSIDYNGGWTGTLVAKL